MKCPVYFQETWSLTFHSALISLIQYWFRNVCGFVANITEHYPRLH